MVREKLKISGELFLGYFGLVLPSYVLWGWLLVVVVCIVLPGCDNLPPQAPPKIAIINPSTGLNDVVDGFMYGMQQLGYEDGKNVTYFYYHTTMDEVDAVIEDIKLKGVDLVYSLTTPATFKAKKALVGTGIPLVFGPVFSPVDSEIVDSLNKPGGNLTGLMIRGSTAKALGWMQAVVPGVKRLFVPFHCTDIAARMSLSDLRVVANKLNIELVIADITTEDELKKVLGNIPENVDGLWLTCSYLLFAHVHDIVAAAMARKLPVASGVHISHSGVLISYGDDNNRIGQHISHMAGRILRGASPKDMPIEMADFLLTINLNTAKQLGIWIPHEILNQADVVER